MEIFSNSCKSALLFAGAADTLSFVLYLILLLSRKFCPTNYKAGA